MEEAMSKKKLFSILVPLVLLAVVVLGVYVSGLSPRFIISDSMYPTIDGDRVLGDMVVVRSADYTSIKVGDIIGVDPVTEKPLTSTGKGYPIYHRVVAMGYHAGMYLVVTQGDAFEYRDKPLGISLHGEPVLGNKYLGTGIIRNKVMFIVSMRAYVPVVAVVFAAILPIILYFIFKPLALILLWLDKSVGSPALLYWGKFEVLENKVYEHV
jgi:signal peptidase I